MLHSSNTSVTRVYHEIKEIKVSLPESQWGYIDRLLIWPQIKEADLVDLKTGVYRVEPAEKNIQLQAYTSGVFDIIGWLNKINGHIIQPHFNEASSWTYARTDLDLLKNKQLAIINNARMNRGKVFHPGWEQCRFCGNKADCVGLRDFAFQLVPAYQPEFVVPQPVHPSEITDDELLNRCLIFAKIMEKWCDSVKHHITELARAGHDFRNFRLIDFAGTRKITRPVRAWELLKEKGFTLEEYLNCCDPQMGKIDETIMAKTPSGQKKRAKEALSILLQDEAAMEIGPPTFQMRARPPSQLAHEQIEK
jgi:hypothetical protein